MQTVPTYRCVAAGWPSPLPLPANLTLLVECAAQSSGDSLPPDFTDMSPELTKPLRGLKVWLPLQLHGLAAFRAQLWNKVQLARWAADAIAAIPGAVIVRGAVVSRA